jgi:hypothetical protein
MPRPRLKTLSLLVWLLLAPLLPPSAAQAGATSATFSVGIRIVPRHVVATLQPAQKPKATKDDINSDASTKVAPGKSR